MAVRKPLVQVGGSVQELPTTDALLTVLAVFSGDITPNPGADGVIVWSSVMRREVVWDAVLGVWKPLYSKGRTFADAFRLNMM